MTDATNPTEDGIALRPALPADPALRTLTACLDRELTARYPGGEIFGIDLDSPAAGQVSFLVAWMGGRPVGCGGVRPLDARTAELKRMFVEKGCRRRGVARALLQALEAVAVGQGFAVLRLETGRRQPEAIALYRRAGYREIPRFGEYAAHEDSVCFEKDLTNRARNQL